MTTLIVHGTLAKGSTWYWSSWSENGFCRAVADGMAQNHQAHDIWLANGRPVKSFEALNPKVRWTPWRGASDILQTVEGRYEWTGSPEGLARGAAAIWLVQYLNALRKVTGEPIRIIAHSHGCNVVKLASSLPELDRAVFIERAVFLACPHFWEEDYEFETPRTLEERLDIRKQMTPRRVGRKFRYRVSPDRFGRILNLYSRRDEVQLTLAETWSGAYAPQTGGFVENLLKSFRTLDVYERPHGTRTDEDPLARGLYEDREVPVAADCSGIEAHSVLHGATVGRAVGRWLSSGDTTASVGKIPEAPASDTGA